MGSARAAARAAARATSIEAFWQRLLAAELPPNKNRALLAELGSFRGDPLRFLLDYPGLTPAERRRMLAPPDSALANGLGRGVRLVERNEFPPLLQDGSSLPALFAHGDFGCLEAPTVAIVGTRAASTYGKACAQKFAEALARAGATVVSGGALGIDAAAHKGTLAGGGRTVAVLAAGVDNVYPAVHAGLFEQIKASGCLVSQFALGTKPSDYKFLVRNDLIAALSRAVLVVEAPARSGALRTANTANDLGREVFVVPANIDNRNFHGSFNLIRDGATLVDHPDQLLEALGIESQPTLDLLGPASTLGERILSVLTVEPLAPEFIVERTGLETSDVLSELTMLELEGRVIRDGVGYAIRP